MTTYKLYKDHLNKEYLTIKKWSKRNLKVPQEVSQTLEERFGKIGEKPIDTPAEDEGILIITCKGLIKEFRLKTESCKFVNYYYVNPFDGIEHHKTEEEIKEDTDRVYGRYVEPQIDFSTIESSYIVYNESVEITMDTVPNLIINRENREKLFPKLRAKLKNKTATFAEFYLWVIIYGLKLRGRRVQPTFVPELQKVFNEYDGKITKLEKRLASYFRNPEYGVKYYV